MTRLEPRLRPAPPILYSSNLLTGPRIRATAEDNKPAVVEPSARAIGSRRQSLPTSPEGNLLPPPSAAMQAPGGHYDMQPAVNLAAEQKAQASQAPAITGPKYTGEPISVNLKDVDLKDFFRLIHEISGLNVVLDPNVKGSLTIVLDDVPWDQALDIVLKNNDLARQLEGNVLRIATVETLRKEAECTARPAGSRSAGGGQSHGHPLPELCPLQGCRAHGEEVPHPARRCDL